MKVFRIAKKQHIRDLSGAGAKLYGGRWNQKGVGVVYTSESKSLVTVESLVHVPLALQPLDLCLAHIEISDSMVPEAISLDTLPSRWREYPAPITLSQLGSEWALSKRSLLLKVPSAVIEGEWNILMNPSHSEFRKVKIVEVARYQIDPRLLR